MEYPIQYTGHPFVDVGIGAVLAMVGKYQPETLTHEDLKLVADQLLVWYCEKPAAQNYISIIFPNAWFTQPKKSLDDKRQYGNMMLFGFQHDKVAETGQPTCPYFPYLKPYHVAKRQHIPLLNSEEATNFSAKGIAGLPISGLALLFIHAMPLGCFKCSGRYLAFHQISASNENRPNTANRVLAALAWEYTRTYIALDTKIPSYGSHPRTRFVDALLTARTKLEGRARLNNITGYYFTNYGTDAKVEILQFSNAMVDFIEVAQQDYAQDWNSLIRTLWVEEKISSDDAPIHPQLAWRNRFFESLLKAEDKPLDFLSLLKRNLNLARLFLRKVMNMQDAEFDLYVQMGRKLAEYVHRFDYNKSKNSLSWGFYHQFKDAKPNQLRKLLNKARESWSKAGESEPLIPTVDIVRAFERKTGMYGQFDLARDIVAYVLFDELHKLGHTMHDSKVVSVDEDEIAQAYALVIQSSEQE